MENNNESLNNEFDLDIQFVEGSQTIQENDCSATVSANTDCSACSPTSPHTCC